MQNGELIMVRMQMLDGDMVMVMVMQVMMMRMKMMVMMVMAMIARKDPIKLVESHYWSCKSLCGRLRPYVKELKKKLTKADRAKLSSDGIAIVRTLPNGKKTVPLSTKN